jgi:hypothetical protein
MYDLKSDIDKILFLLKEEDKNKFFNYIIESQLKNNLK